MTERTPAVVIGCGRNGATALNVIRALGRSRIPVTHLCPERGSAAAFSRYARCIRAPRIATDAQGFLSRLLELGGEGDPQPALIAVTEAEMLFLSRHRDLLAQRFHLSAMSAERIMALADKWLQCDAARRAGLPIPGTLLLNSRAAIEHVADGFTFPVLARPRTGHAPPQRFETRAQWLRGAPALYDSPVHFLMQEMVPGKSRARHQAVVYRGCRGALLASMVTRTIHACPRQTGTPTLVETVDMPNLVDLAQRYLTAAGYHGAATVEFKFDETSGRATFVGMEMGYGFPETLALRAGVNFALTEYSELLGQNSPPVSARTAGLKWWRPLLDLRGAFNGGREYGALEWLRSCAGAHAETLFASDDSKPFLFHLAGLARLPLPRVGRERGGPGPRPRLKPHAS